MQAALPLDALLTRLIEINSVNPMLAPDAPGEAAIARYVADWASARGFQVEWIDASGGEGMRNRPSVVVRAPGRGGGRSLMLLAHLDTVGVAGMSAPFRARREGRFLYGRGSCDMKAGLAANMRALERIAALGLRGDVLLSAVADEEHGSLGCEAMLARMRADAAILTEPTGMQLCLAHRGFVVIELILHGRASHSSQPERGVDAIALAGQVMQGIARLNQSLRERARHPLLGWGALQITRIDGGSELFTTPARCVMLIERRTLPGEESALVLSEVQAVLDQVRTHDDRLRADMRVVLARDAMETGAEAVIAQAVRAAAEQRLGRPVTQTGAPYWMDSGLFPGHAIPIVVFGVTGYGMHAADERVDLDEAAQLEDILVDSARRFCGDTP